MSGPSVAAAGSTECTTGRLEGIAWIPRTSELDSLGNRRGQRRWVRALDRVDAFAAVEDLEGGHRGDAVGARNFGLLVDVDLGEGHLSRA